MAPVVLMIVGALAASASLLVDLVTGGDGEFSVGMAQLFVAGAGVAIFLNGLALREEAGRLRLEEFLALGLQGQLVMVARYTLLVLQLAVLYAVLTRFRIENEAFYSVLVALAFGGVCIHHLVPLQYRMGFMLALSLVAMARLFGLADGAYLALAGTVLVLLCYLPVRFGWCIALVLAAWIALALGRADKLAFPWSAAIWPILGSMFMFRMAIFLYDVYHEEKRPPLVQSLAYFFLLPNLTFPFFPVVDFTVFRRTYYDSPAFEIYQKGIRWMTLGVVQLILYRVVYQYAMLPMSEVQSAADLARYMVANFGLYIRVSGQFHMIVGLLHLFGFNLPRTNNKYFLAAGITDLWRRINIYWTEFMQKMVFNPVYFRLREKGDKVALSLGVVAVFVLTWALHSYQWFWLLGDFPVTGPDTLYWGILGTVMVFTTLREAKKGRVRRLPKAKQGWSLREQAPIALKIAGTFAFTCILWSLWTSPTLDDWVALITLR